MQFKPALFVTSTLAILAAASPLEARTGGGSTPTQCQTGSVQCCQSAGKASDFDKHVLWGLIQVVVTDLTAAIGLQCSPVVGGGSCDQQPVCCTGNNYQGGLIVIGCSPIILS